MSRVGVFGYGSLVAAASASMTLGRELAAPPAVAELEGWRRRWSQARLNERCEKTFAAPDGSIPEWVLGLNVERVEGATGAPPNGAVLEVSGAELELLDRRELRYRPIDVTEAVRPCDQRSEELIERFDRIVVYAARDEHFHPDPPDGAVIIAAYAAAVESAFATLGPDQLELYRRTTGPYPVPRIEGRLVRDRIPDGNPRDW